MSASFATSPARRHPHRHHPGHRLRDPARLIHSHTRRSPAPGSGHTSARPAEKQTPDAQNQTVSVQTRSEAQTSELQSLMRISYAAFLLQKNTNKLSAMTLKLLNYTYCIIRIT